MSRTNRIVSLEVMRVAAMFMVVLSHSFVWGMPFQSPKSALVLNNVLYPLFNAFYSSNVNCFLIISGFFLSKSYNPKYFKAGKIWLQTFFYSVLFWLLFRFFGHNTDHSFISAALPIVHDQYWFVTQYLILLVLSPFLARWCDSMDQKTYLYLLVVLFLLIGAVISQFPLGQLLFNGSRTPSFIFLYMLAGYIARYELPSWIDNNSGWLFLAIIVVQWLGGLFLNYWYKDTGLIYGAFSSTQKGLPLLSSAALLVWFKKQNWQECKIAKAIAQIAPFVFGVYLIHENLLVRPLIWDKVNVSSFWDSYLFYPYVLAVCILIFILCFIVDLVRDYLFNLPGKLIRKKEV